MFSTNTTPSLATRFARNTFVVRSETPLAEERMRQAAPSIFAQGKHASRSERYTYIPTIEVLRGLRKEGFEPFMVAQSKSRIEGKTDFTKHMIRMRHVRDDAGRVDTRPEANEIILINSHDGASSYQMLAGVFRFVCCNGLVVGSVSNDIRIPHKGDIRNDVIEGAFRVLDDFEAVDASMDGMKALTLQVDEERAFATAALALRYGERVEGRSPAPVTAEQLIEARRPEDQGRSLWSAFQRVQENSLRGGQSGRSVQGRRMQTRAVGSIDRSVNLNRALWVLAEEMRRLKAQRGTGRVDRSNAVTPPCFVCSPRRSGVDRACARRQGPAREPGPRPSRPAVRGARARTSGIRYFVPLREASTPAAWVLLRLRNAAIAGK